jgi:uncharacterized protein YggE
MRILKPLLLLAATFVIPSAWAQDSGDMVALLNKVTVRLTAEQYVPTKTALVSVGVSASVTEAGLQNIQDDILKKLTSLSDQGEWHITAFDRSQDQSGLEKVQISAQARLPSAALTSLRDKSKTMSKPGQTFTVDNVEFTPSDDEMRAANTALRSVIYQQAKDEADRLNKAYPDQKYYVHDVNFLDLMMAPGPIMPMNAMVMRGNNQSFSPKLSVGDKLIINATVVLAAMPDQLNKALH